MRPHGKPKWSTTYSQLPQVVSTCSCRFQTPFFPWLPTLHLSTSLSLLHCFHAKIPPVAHLWVLNIGLPNIWNSSSHSWKCHWQTSCGNLSYPRITNITLVLIPSIMCHLKTTIQTVHSVVQCIIILNSKWTMENKKLNGVTDNILSSLIS